MKELLIIEEMKDIAFREIIRKNCEDEMLHFYSELIGEGDTAVIPLKENVLLIYSAGTPLRDFKLKYSHYYYDKIMLPICLAGEVLHSNGDWLTASIHNGESFLYSVEKDNTYIEVKKGRKYEQVSLVLDKNAFYDSLNRFFDEDSQPQKKELLDKLFSKNTTGKVFDITSEIRIICRQILACRLTGNYRRVFLECKFYEILAYYFQSITYKPEQEIKFSADDIKRLQEAKKLLVNQNQILSFSVDKLCREVGLNRFKLNAGFQAIFNTSIIKFYRSVILAKAYADLQNTQYNSIEEIGLNYGYGSVQAFSNAFFKEFGVRPSQVKSLDK